MTYLVQIHQRRFAINDDAIHDLQQSILDAVHAGGGFIALSETSSVLVSSHSPILIEHLPPALEDPPTGAIAPDFAFYDFDQDL